jgi:sigma-B regulation protein RsbU (phosphoserine phosphatase)
MNTAETNHGATILVVEDSLTQALKLQYLLEGQGYQAPIARNGREALDALQNATASLVISDIEMPEMDGYELCRRIKADDVLKKLPVMLLTSLSEPKDVIHGLECGADSFLMKPYDQEILLSRIRYMLAKESTGESSNEIFFAGETHSLAAQPNLHTTVGLLLGTYETVMQKNQELTRAKETVEHQAEELRAKNALMEADLGLAREIQQSFLPRQYPSFPHTVSPFDSALQFCHRWIPTTTLGGDFFDVLALSDTKAGVFICDVMGHGVRSALITAMMRALVGERTSEATDPGLFLTEINRHLISILQATRTPMFASGFYLIIDVSTGEMLYSNAGHPSPLWVRREAGIVEPLACEAGPALGVFPDMIYETAQCQTAPRDLIMLFTDGLFEVESAQEEVDDEYGEERLHEAVRRRIQLPSSTIFDGILTELQAFSGQAEFEDDVCAVGVDIVRLG